VYIDFLKDSLHTVLEDCRKAAEDLEDVATFIYRKDGPTVSGKRDGLSKLRRKSDKDQELGTLRRRIQSDQSTLTAMLAALSPYYSIGSHVDTKDQIDKIGEDLQDQIKNAVSQLEASQRRHIQDLMNAVQQPQPLRQPLYRNEKFYVPKPLSPIFTGRDSELEALKADFGIPFSPDRPFQQQRRFVVQGMGGSGKTQFTVKFAELNRDHFWAILNVDATSHETIAASYRKIARIAGSDVEQDTEGAMNWLSNLQQTWLLVIDNAELIKENGSSAVKGTPRTGILSRLRTLEDYFPCGNRGCIIITTRNIQHRRYGNIGRKYLSFEKMQEDDAVELLIKAAGVDSVGNTDQAEVDKWAPIIAEKLAYLPLALEHAGTAIQDIKCDWETYIDEYFNTTYERIGRLGNPEEQLDQDRNVFATFEIIYLNLEKHKQDAENTNGRYSVYSDALDLLSIFTYLHNNDIQVDMLLRAASHAENDEPFRSTSAEDAGAPKARNFRPAETISKKMRRQLITLVDRLTTNALFLRLCKSKAILPPILRDSIPTKLRKARLDNALNELVKRSVVSRHDSTGSYFIHALVHQWLRMREPHRSVQALWCECASTVVASCIDIGFWTSKKKHVERSLNPRSLLPHVDHIEKVRKELDTYFRHCDKLCPWLFRPGWLCSPSVGRGQAEKWAKFSIVYSYCGQYHDAYALQQDLYDYVVPRRGKEDTISIGVTRLLAGSNFHLTRTPAAGELLNDVVMACEYIYGQNHTETLKAQDDLGFVRCLQGRFIEARKLLSEAYEGLDKLEGESRKENLDAIMNAQCHLAIVQLRYFEFDKARQLLEPAVEELQREKNGDPQTLNAMQDLAETYAILGERGPLLDRAKEMMLQVLDAREKMGGNEHPLTLLARKNLAEVNFAMGEYKAGEDLLEPTVKLAEKTLGSDHYAIPMGKVLLARLVMAQGRHGEALALLHETRGNMEAIAARQGSTPDRMNPDNVVVLSRIVECLEQQGKHEDALAAAQKLWKAIGNVGQKDKAYDHPAAGRLWRKIRGLEDKLGIDHSELTTSTGAIPRFMDKGNGKLDERVMLA